LANNYTFQQAPANTTALSINPALLTYVANPASQTYGSSNTAFTGTVSGFVNGETLASATAGTAVFTSTSSALISVGLYAINGSGLTASNYTFAQAPTNATALTIKPALLTYVANPASQTYGSSNTAFIGNVTGFVNADTLASATTGTAVFTSSANALSNVGTYAINGTGLNANLGNYTFNQAAGNATALTINPATLNYVANPLSQIFGSGNAFFAGIVTGFVNGQTLASATTGTAVFTSATTASSSVGNYAINGSGLTANLGNYSFTQAAGNASALTIATGVAPTPPGSTTTLTLAVNNTAILNSQTPVFTSLYTGAAVSGLDVSSLLAGLTYQITPTLSGPGTYQVTATGTAPAGYSFSFAPATLIVIDYSPATAPSLVNVLKPEVPSLLTEPQGTLAGNILPPVNALGQFQVSSFGVSFSSFSLVESPLAASYYFTNSANQSTTYVAGVKP
jgi:hypothetical protein